MLDCHVLEVGFDIFRGVCAEETTVRWDSASCTRDLCFDGFLDRRFLLFVVVVLLHRLRSGLLDSSSSGRRLSLGIRRNTLLLIPRLLRPFIRLHRHLPLLLVFSRHVLLLTDPHASGLLFRPFLFGETVLFGGDV